MNLTPKPDKLELEMRNKKILSGVAWLTVAREDIILTQGEKTSFTPREDVLISALSNAPLILEIYEK